MKNYLKEIGLGVILMGVFIGLLIWAVLAMPQQFLMIIIAAIIILVAVITYFVQVLKKKADLQAGVPAEDEFTRQARVYAGSQAFTFSMYLWLLIFVFNSAFSKPQTMLGIGILGSALIYGVWLLYFRTTGNFNEE